MTYKLFKQNLRKALDNNEPLCVTLQHDKRLDRNIQMVENYVPQFIFDENILGKIEVSRRKVISLTKVKGKENLVTVITFTYNVSDE